MTFERRVRVGVPATELFAWHLRPGAFERLVPPWDGTRVAARSGRIEDDSMQVTLSVPVLGPLRQRWQVQHEGFEAGRSFRDRMVSGPFALWLHTHSVEDDGAGGSVLVDHIDYRLPLGVLGRIAGGAMVRRRLERMFVHRHAVTGGDLEAHAACPMPAGTVVQIAPGGSRSMAVQLAAFLATGGALPRGVEGIIGLDDALEAAGEAAVRVELEGMRATVSAGDRLTTVDIGDDPVAGPRLVGAAIHDCLQ